MKTFLEDSFYKMIESVFLFIYIIGYVNLYTVAQTNGERVDGAIMVGVAYGLTIVMIRGIRALYSKLLGSPNKKTSS